MSNNRSVNLNFEDDMPSTIIKSRTIPPNPKTILIAVSDGFSGYGDFLFGLKLAEQLRSTYRDIGREIPSIKLITQITGKEKIIQLKGHEEFAVDVLTPSELAKEVNEGTLEVELLIEGPVFENTLIEAIDNALQHHRTTVPLLLIAEYGNNNAESIINMDKNTLFRQADCSAFECIGTLYPGFNIERDECGIIPSQELLNLASREVLFNQLDTNIRSVLLKDGLDSTQYQEQAELSLQYSHDTYDVAYENRAAKHFLEIHRELYQSCIKNQDVVMVGNSKKHKLDALRKIIDKLKLDGFKHISFYNLESGKEEVLYNAGSTGNQKSYRVIYAKKLPHLSFVALTGLSGPLMGATGDQSFGEALSANKVFVYECLLHKIALISNYDKAIIAQSEQDQQIITTIELLRKAKEDSEYLQLGKLLRDPLIQKKLIESNQKVLKKWNFIGNVIKAHEEFDLTLKERILFALQEGHSKEALDLYLRFNQRLNLDALYGEIPFIEQVQRSGQSDWLHFYTISNLLNNKKPEEAWALLIELPHFFNEKRIIEELLHRAIKEDKTGFFSTALIVHLLKTLRRIELIPLINRYAEYINFNGQYEGKTLLEHAKEAQTESSYLQVMGLTFIFLLKGKQFDEAISFQAEHEKHLSSELIINGKKLLDYLFSFDAGILLKRYLDPIIRQAVVTQNIGQQISLSFKLYKSPHFLGILEDKELRDYIHTHTPDSILLKYYYKLKIAHLLLVGESREVIEIVKEHHGLFSGDLSVLGTLPDGTMLNNVQLDSYAKKLNQKEAASYIAASKIHWHFKNGMLFWDIDSILDILKSMPYLDLGIVFEGESCLQIAQKNQPATNKFLIYYYSIQINRLVSEDKLDEAVQLFKDNSAIFTSKSLLSLFTFERDKSTQSSFLIAILLCLFKADKQPEFLEIIEIFSDRINFNTVYKGKPFLNYVQEFTAYEVTYKLNGLHFLALMTNDQFDKAVLFYSEYADQFSYDLIINEKNLIEHVVELDKTGEIIKVMIKQTALTQNHVQTKGIAVALSKSRNALTLLDDQELLHFVEVHTPQSPLLEFYYILQAVNLLQCDQNKKALEWIIKHRDFFKSNSLYINAVLTDGTKINEPWIEYVRRKGHHDVVCYIAAIEIYNAILNKQWSSALNTLELAPYVDLSIQFDTESILEVAEKNRPESKLLLSVYYAVLIVKALNEGKVENARGIIEKNYEFLEIYTPLPHSLRSVTPRVITLIDYIRSHNFIEINSLCNAQYIYNLQKKFPYGSIKYNLIISALQQKNTTPNFTHLFDQESILSLAEKERPASDSFLKYYYQLLTAEHLKNGREQEAVMLLRKHFTLIDLNTPCHLRLADGTLFTSSLLMEAANNHQTSFIKCYHQLTLQQFTETNQTSKVKTYLKELVGTHLSLVSPQYIANQMQEYSPFPNSKRYQAHHAVLNLADALIQSPDLYDERALIGLLLLIRKDIAAEYKWLSPRKGFFFGSRLYSLCEDTLLALGCNVNNLNEAAMRPYLSALSEAKNKISGIKEHPYFNTAVAKALLTPYLEDQPPTMEIISQTNSATIEEIEEPLVQDDHFVEERAILTGEKKVDRDPSILQTEKGFYRLGSQIGKGGWSVVYAGSYYWLNEDKVEVQDQLAIKNLSLSSSLEKECTLFNRVYPEHHFATFKQKGKSYLVMPHFPGTPLDEYLLSSQFTEATFKQRVSMAIGLCVSLQTIHKYGVVHNDIKPKNIVFDPETKTLSILDFGCAEEEGGALKYKNIMTAKFALEYMPPEYHQGTTAQKATDLYSMTLSLAEILGVNKRQVVEARMERALKDIPDEAFKQQLRTAFLQQGTLDEAIFSADLSSYHGSTLLEQFVQNYVSNYYDFSLYQDQIGNAGIDLLNSMQAHSPNHRPSLEECLSTLNSLLQKEQVKVFTHQNHSLFPNVAPKVITRYEESSTNTALFIS